MKYTALYPSPHLRKFVKYFWLLESTQEENNQLYRSTPDGYIELSFQLKTSWKWGFNGAIPTYSAPTMIVAQFTRSLEFVAPTLAKNLYIKFYPHTFFQLFGIPVHEFTNRHFTLDEVFGQEIEALRQRLLPCQNLNEMKVFLEDWLNEKLKKSYHIAPCILQMIDTIEQQHGKVKIRDLQQQYPHSQRWLQQQFLNIIGVTPKQYAQFKRNFLTVKLLKKQQNLTALAYQLGYTDQSHFIRDFKQFAGCSPKVYHNSINPDGNFHNFSIQ